MKGLMAIIAVLLLSALWASPQGRVTFKEGEKRIEVEIGGEPFAVYHYGDEWMKPFLHAVRARSGAIVTRGYPVEKIAGESNDHFWHHGIWYGHGDINGVDFWREFTGDPKQDAKFPLPVGRFALKGKPQLKAGAESGTLTANLEFVRPDKSVIGTMRQIFTFRGAAGDRLIDAEITISADRGTALRMGDTEEGSFGLRFADEFKEDRGATLTNSEGLTGTSKIWGKRARWVDYSTTIKGEQLGVAIFDHPQNPKHPTYWHARGYGLCGVNPFGEHDFHDDKTRDGSVTIPAGKSLTFRYRVVIHQGAGEKAKIDRMFADYAKR